MQMSPWPVVSAHKHSFVKLVELGCIASRGGIEVLRANFLLIFNFSIIQLFNVDCLNLISGD